MAAGQDTVRSMSEQSKWTVGSALGLGVLLLALFANFNARFDDFSARLDDQSAQIAGLRTDVAGQLADLRAEVRADVRRLDDRLRAERILIPAPDAGTPDE